MSELQLDNQEIRGGAGFAALAYIPFLWILVFIFKKENKFSHYHAKQGLVIFIGEVIFLLLTKYSGFIGTLLAILFLILSLYGIFSALMGKLCKIPLISGIAAKLVI